MNNEGFAIDPWTGMLFFRVCRRYHINDLDDRTCLMRELVRRKKAWYIRDINPLLVGKKVLNIGFKPSHNDGPEHFCPECRPKEKS